jgi:hypothetical protein
VGGGNMPRVAAKLPIASAGGTPTFEISEGDRKRIEEAYGRALIKPVWRKIRDATREYLEWAGLEKAAQRVSEAEARVNAIKAAARKFRDAIFRCPQNIREDADFFARHLISKRLGLSFQGRDGLKNLVLKIERDLLDTCNRALKVERDISDACERALDDLQKGNNGFRDGEIWGLWIRKLTKILKAHRLPTEVRKDTNKNLTGNPSPFVAFVRELQACIPKEYRRSQPSSAAASTNIALSEAIYRARRVRKDP